jgi:protein-S-isoprenylcysteine O-methyltransferase Ste14
MIVTFQFGLLGVILWHCGIPHLTPVSAALSILSGIIGLWSIGVMRLRNLRIRPEPKSNAQMRVSGPYRVIRHPMYLSVLLLAASFVSGSPDTIAVSLFVMLTATIVVKLEHEEKLLKQKFPEYAGYGEQTKKLIPYLY